MKLRTQRASLRSNCKMRQPAVLNNVIESLLKQAAHSCIIVISD